MASQLSVLCNDGSFAVLFPSSDASGGDLGLWMVMAVPKNGAEQKEPDYEVLLIKDWRKPLDQSNDDPVSLLQEIKPKGVALYPSEKIVAAVMSRRGEELFVQYGPMSGPDSTWNSSNPMEVIGGIGVIEMYFVKRYDSLSHKVCSPNKVAPKRTV